MRHSLNGGGVLNAFIPNVKPAEETDEAWVEVKPLWAQLQLSNNEHATL